MHPLVRDLYKRALVAGKDYPLGLDWVRAKAKKEFAKNKLVQNEIELKRTIAYGRYLVREMQAVIGLKKYRTIRARYNNHDENSS